MPDLLVEIGCDEIPARMLPEGLGLLWGGIAATLKTYRLLPSDYDTSQEVLGFYTPRRLAVYCPRITAKQPDIEKQISGPSIKVAFKDGAPTPAAQAFAKRVGLSVEQLGRATSPKGEYLVANIVETGRAAIDILAETLPSDISGIYWAKT